MIRRPQSAPTPARERTPHPPSARALGLAVLLAAAVSLAATCSGESAAASGGVAFERYELELGRAFRPAVLTGALLGGPAADLAVVSVEHDERRLRIHSFAAGAWSESLTATLRPEISFVDVADLAGEERLIAYGDGLLTWFDPIARSERPLVEVDSDFAPPDLRGVLHVDITHDVNDDGLDDLTVPFDAGYEVFVQRRDGTFAEPVAVGHPSATGRVYGPDGYRYDPWTSGHVHSIDYDLDGRSDLAFWSGDRFEVHLQKADGSFRPTSTELETTVPFDSDELASLVAPHGVSGREIDEQPPGAMTGRVLFSLRDHDGDGVGDLAIFSLRGGSLWRMRSSYEVHFGEAGPSGGIQFQEEAGAVVRSDGIPFGIDARDLDGDGRLDVQLTTIDPGFFRVVRMLLAALFTDSVPLDLELYRMDEAGYPRRPTARRTIRAGIPSGGKGEGRTFFPPILYGDVEGDGRADLLLGRSEGELRVFPGRPDDGLFARHPEKVEVTLPQDEEHTWLADLDRDGLQDVVMHHPAEDAPDRVTLLISRPGS